MSTGYEEARRYARQLELAELEEQAAECLLLGMVVPVQILTELDQIDLQRQARRYRRSA